MFRFSKYLTNMADNFWCRPNRMQHRLLLYVQQKRSLLVRWQTTCEGLTGKTPFSEKITFA
jgi:hypothetical protein